MSSASKSLIEARGRHGHFDTHQRFFDFKINFFFIVRVRQVPYDDSRLIQSGGY